MKRKYSYFDGKKQTEREYSYIPVRYILAVLITLLEVVTVIGIVVALCYYVPYFYLAAWATEIVCVIRIIASDDNPDYKVPWLLFVLIIPMSKKTADYKTLFFRNGVYAVAKMWFEGGCVEPPEQMGEIIKREYKKAFGV